MAHPSPVVVFFDIGQTLGSARVSAPPVRLTGLDLYPYVLPILQQLRAAEIGAQLGIISNTGDDNGDFIDQILAECGILDFFNSHLRIYSKDVGLRKDSPFIFQLAAGRAGAIASALPRDCIFVGEDSQERAFAAEAGLRVSPHPTLVIDLLNEHGVS